MANMDSSGLFIKVNDPSLNRNIGKYQLPTYGMRSFSTPLASTSNRLSLLGKPGPLYEAHITCPPAAQWAHIMCLQHQKWVDMESCNITNLVAHILAPGSSLCIINGGIYGHLFLVNITFSCRLEEAIWFAMVKGECLSVVQYFFWFFFFFE